MADLSLESFNSIAGAVALLNSLLLVPTIRALRKLADRHEDKLEEHTDRLQVLEAVREAEVARVTPKSRRKKVTRR